jgi:hypothetical protein
MGDRHVIPPDARNVKFSMLREQHFERARTYFGTDDFDRLFIVHALDSDVRTELKQQLIERRIYWLTIPELVADLYAWYQTHERKAALRCTLTGDLLHLLFGLCRFSPQPDESG